MAYEIKETKGKFYVVDTETQRIRGGPYNDEDDADDRKDELDFRAEVRAGIGRIPGKELSPEEKAAEYDRLMAEKKNSDPNVPPKKDGDGEPPDKDKDKKPRRSAYWGEAINDN